MLSALWNQVKYEHDYHLDPEKVLPQSKGQCRMVTCPKQADLVSFVYRGKIVMRGRVISEGFVNGTEHQVHSCNLGDTRPHSVPQEYAKVKITDVGLSESIRKTGQRTWAKMLA